MPHPSVRVVTPCRADLAGGTLDIWPLGVLHSGALTVNVAIPVRVVLDVTTGGPEGGILHTVDGGERTELDASRVGSSLTATIAYHLQPAGGITIRVLEQAPVGSGLGGSSAYAVALARALLALDGRRMADAALVALLRDLEARVLDTATGTQDYWAALWGGCLSLHLDAGGERVERMPVTLSWLEERLLVMDSGIRHHSGMVNWRVIRRRMDGDPEVKRAFDVIAEAARQCRMAVAARDEGGAGAAIEADWRARRTLAPEVCPPELERLENAAVEAGALAFKACGAGGGGAVLVWHRPGERDAVRAALEAAGATPLAEGVDRDGCSVEVAPEDTVA